ncbi:tetratricopeptide repeat protein [Maliponia aquimaris]|uniref:Putative beta-lactamase HcpC n=1 Tax=Maliponia aquimaris TaxID=1673631 RepID=A0A238KFL1_9RHOB|nr:tetratricopeptide repeat protein [Maliponia aquimaris]SMX40816.1 Putative beta-lactamase HcpC precursor [Maliponia aquimaris]
MRPGLSALALALALAAPATAQTDPMTTLRAAAEQGVPAAELELARRFEAGDGVLQNFARAAEWYARAAEAGSAEAANRLGRMHHAGLGVPQDLPRAIALLERAAESGKADYLNDLALVLESVGADDAAALARAATLYRQAAEAGHVDAAVSLGVLLQDGRGVEKDPTAAADLYRGAAEAGHARAQNNLGLLYVRGDGVAQDYAEAARMFQAAAEQGLPEALTNLGVLYENGFGVPQNDTLAAELYRQGGQGDRARAGDAGPIYDPRLAPPPTDAAGLKALEKAALAGDPVAEFQMAWLLLSATPREPRRTMQGAILMRRAAEAGHAPAMANLALLYFEGTGLPQDYVLGQMWLVLAGSGGFAGAAEISALWTRRMTADQVNEAQARAEALWTAQGVSK